MAEIKLNLRNPKKTLTERRMLFAEAEFGMRRRIGETTVDRCKHACIMMKN